jgi:LysM repeat protein
MRAAPRPHSSETSAAPLGAGEARAALVRIAIALFATLALLVVWHPAVVHAQDKPAQAKPASPQPVARTTHVVGAGESLWSIAARYYGDGGAWSELARSNGIASSSARPLVVGMKLRVPAVPPARAAGAPAPAARPPADVAKVAIAVARPPRAGASGDEPAPAPRAGNSLATQTAGKNDAPAVTPRNAAARSAAGAASGAAAPGRRSTRAPALAVADKSTAVTADSSPTALRASTRATMQPQVKVETPIDRGAVRIGLLGPGDAQAARGRDYATIFLRRIPSQAEADASVQSSVSLSPTAPRRGEYDAAPFAVAPSELLKSGRILRRVGSADMGPNDGPGRMLIADEVEVTPPAGVTLSVGDRLVALNVNGLLVNGLRVVVPGGVLQVTQADAGRPAIAVVKSQSGLLEQGQALVPIQGGPAAVGTATSTGVEALKTSVTWVDNNSLLPTLQSFVLLDAGSGQGVRAGDEFSLVRTRGSANTGAEDRIAIVRVVRVGANGSTAIVVKQDRAEIATGVTARLTARMP